MDTRNLGTNGPAVSAIGLGCMGMSPDLYGAADEAESIATIHAAIDAGVTLLDTGDFYGMGHNELLIGRALRDRRRDDVTLSVKFGAQRGPDGAWLGFDAQPARGQDVARLHAAAARHRPCRRLPPGAARPRYARSRTPSARSPS